MIYLVDDDKSIRNAIKLLAKSASFDIQTFASAEEFLEIGNTKENDCLILDIHIPGMNGFQLLKKMQEMGKKLNVIILTAYDDDNNRKLAHEYEVRAFFRKPCDSQALIDTLNYIESHA